MNADPTGAIDVHTHFVPPDFPAVPSGSALKHWPQMRPAASCGHCHIFIDGKNYRTVGAECWDADLRLRDMLSTEVAMQALSPMPELLSYWMDAADAQVLLRHVNESMAALVSVHPRAFVALGAVPLQDVALAIAELRHAMDVLGFAGVEIGSNVNGVPIGDARFEPFFEAAEALGAAIFVHPLRPAGMERLVGPAQLEQALAFPGETGLAGASLITSGLLERRPGLRICLSHGGGTLAALLPRLAHARGAFPALQACMPLPPLDYARRLYVDDLVYDAATLKHLLATFGASQVMVGTDYPFAIMERDPQGRLAEAALAPDVLAALRQGNARRFLGLDLGAHPKEQP